MPFKKVAPNRYQAPSGKTMTRRQVNAYYATKGFNRPYKPHKVKPK